MWRFAFSYSIAGACLSRGSDRTLAYHIIGLFHNMIAFPSDSSCLSEVRVKL